MTVVSAENNSDVQLQSISMFVEQGCDAIIVNLVESSLADDVITLAAGTPVVFVNRIPDLELVRGKVVLSVPMKWNRVVFRVSFK